MKRTYQGSCHCGAVRFECQLDLAAGTSRCNCSICGKARFWKAIVPADAFRLRAGADALTSYQFGSGSIAHQFCRRCGIKTFGRVELEGTVYAVNVAALDATDTELAAAPVTYEDGRHDHHEARPAETRHL